MDQKDCKDCGSSVNVKKSGDLWRHKNPDGNWCESTSGTHHVVEAAPMVFDAATKVGDKKPSLSVDVAGVDTPKRATSPKKPASPKKVFTFTMTVPEPCEYLGDRVWENSNKALAYRKAQDSGKSPVGEPYLAGSEVVGRKRVLTYEVPVE